MTFNLLNMKGNLYAVGHLSDSKMADYFIGNRSSYIILRFHVLSPLYWSE